MTITHSLGQKLARAKALLRRDETRRGMEELLSCLEEYQSHNLPGKMRFEIEVQIQECMAFLNRQPTVRSLLESLVKSGNPTGVPYTPGHEQKLKALLTILFKALLESEAAGERKEAQGKSERKSALEAKALAAIKSGDSPKGKATLRILAEEFGHEPDVLRKIGEVLLDYKLYFEAAEFLEQAMEAFPKDGKAYGLAAQCYLTMREFEKGEKVYKQALSRFGGHPRTLLNLAKLYATWNKRDKAFETARDAWKKDDSLTEAKEIMDRFG